MTCRGAGLGEPRRGRGGWGWIMRGLEGGSQRVALVPRAGEAAGVHF